MMSDPKKLFLYRAIMETHKSDQIRVTVVNNSSYFFGTTLQNHILIMIISCYTEFFAQADLQDVMSFTRHRQHNQGSKRKSNVLLRTR